MKEHLLEFYGIEYLIAFLIGFVLIRVIGYIIIRYKRLNK